MSSIAILLIVLAVALLAGLAFVMTRAAKLRPHRRREENRPHGCASVTGPKNPAARREGVTGPVADLTRRELPQHTRPVPSPSGHTHTFSGASSTRNPWPILRS